MRLQRCSAVYDVLIACCSVGLGSDFDGIGSVPEGLEDVSKYPALVRIQGRVFS